MVSTVGWRVPRPVHEVNHYGGVAAIRLLQI